MRLISSWFISVLLESYLLLRDPRQISIQILREFKRINFYSLWNRLKALIVSAEIKVNQFAQLAMAGRQTLQPPPNMVPTPSFPQVKYKKTISYPLPS